MPFFPVKASLSEYLSYSQVPLELPFSMLGGSCPLSATLASRYLSSGKSPGTEL